MIDFEQYRIVLAQAEHKCPSPLEPEVIKRLGRSKRSKSGNLLERLRDYAQETLRFQTDTDLPFTNNQGETIFGWPSLIKYLVVSAPKSVLISFAISAAIYRLVEKMMRLQTTALTLLFEGILPAFIL